MTNTFEWIVLAGKSHEELYPIEFKGAIRFKLKEVHNYAEATKQLCVVKYKAEDSDSWCVFKVFDGRTKEPVPYMPLKDLVKYYVPKDPLTDMPEDLYVQFGEGLYSEQIRYCEDKHGNFGLKKILHGYIGPNGEYKSRLVFVVDKE